MTMTISKLESSTNNSYFYRPAFCRYMESYVPYLKSHRATFFMPITPFDLYKYEGDFYGILSSNKIPQEYHWIVMRMNDLYSPAKVPAGIGGLIVPDFTVIDKILQVYLTKEKTVAP